MSRFLEKTGLIIRLVFFPLQGREKFEEVWLKVIVAELVCLRNGEAIDDGVCSQRTAE